ncbi:CRAL/TRIO domain-containing protein [Stipitochalara longipes BDJ]|nr:CRAL/TRIO domain-containing protein [Stipitochalara longipes BDJ]
MTGEALPGRPGTLTPEQEEKLREFWIATLQVFGVLDPKELNGNGLAEISNGRTRVDTASLKKPEKEKKKKRMSLFRKNKDDDTDSVTSTESTPHSVVADSDDKYGQTKEFHEALASLTPETLRATFWSMVKHDHPDALLLRFLRARKWDVEKALVMMVSTMRWRSADVHVDDDIMKNGELSSLEAANGSDHAKRRLGEDFLAQMRLGKSFLHGVDKNGRPMCFVRVKLHKQGEQSEESLERYTVFVIESARMVLQPPVDTACVVFDMTGFSMANMDYAPVKFMIKCFEANYPESLGVVLVHKAPWIFQGIWKIIKGWLDPVVASKVHFTNNVEEMEAYVPKPQIIHELGGAEDWTYQYIEPVPGENDTMKDIATRDKLLLAREEIVKEYEKVTLEWIRGTGDVDAVKKSRNEIASKLKVDYWGLDPYVRARSYYDRVGMINPGGKIQFYPVKEEKVTVPETVPADSVGIAPPTTNGTKVETSEADLD